MHEGQLVVPLDVVTSPLGWYHRDGNSSTSRTGGRLLAAPELGGG